MLWLKVIAASLVSGLFLGVGGRVAMWIIAMIALGSSGFSWGGTLEVIASGVLFGVPAGLVYAAIRKKLGTPALWKGASFGLLFFILLLIFPPPAAVSASSGLGHVSHITLSLFGILFIAYGIILELLLKRCVIRNA
jgi:hypothetical protein